MRRIVTTFKWPGMQKGGGMSIQRRILNINGIDREVVCDPEKDSLADAVRRLGLTGTKVGCGAGQCGSCTLLLDGKAVRSCTKKMKNVKEYSKVETIEGLGNADHLHPLQKAFTTHAGVQCGFCSPGFIMSAKALLHENPTPTRQDVRDWFTEHNNICRCTGYKPIVDAVMAAAEVMRGEKSPDDLNVDMPGDGRLYGTYFPKPTALTRVLGTCDYGADVAEKMPAGTLHLAVVMAKIPHGRIKAIHMDEAVRMPGVVRVITAKDVKGTNRFCVPQGAVHSACDGRDRPVICDDIVRRHGDIVAVVAAHSREQARAAAEKVVVDYEMLPACMTFMEAARKDAPRLFAQYPNIYIEQPVYKGDDTRDLFAGAAHVAEGSFSTTRQPHMPIEPDVLQAYPQDGGVAIQCKAQFVYGIIGQMADAVGLPKEKIRIIMNPAGASFGFSMSAGNPALVAACALALDAPVSLVMSYEEQQHTTGKRSPIHANARLACDANGRFIALDYLVGLDHGAYSEMAGNLTNKVCRFWGYPYAVPNIRGLVRTAFTNNNFGTAYRAFGSPQTYTGSEQLVDMLAEKLGMDPFELRYRNVAVEGDLCTTSVPYREYPMRGMMDIMRPRYQEAVARAKREDTPEKRRGVGISWGGYHVSKVPDKCLIDLELNEDGSITHYSTWADVGQGADTGSVVHVHEALRELHLDPGQIRLVRNDTATCPDSGPASGSRSHHVVGNATINAAAKLLEAMRKPDGTFRTWREMRDEGIPTKYRGEESSNWGDIDPDTGHGYGAVAQSYVLFMSEVEVDVATGKTRVLATTIVADVGKVGSFEGALGQAWGSYAHSVGYALSERYDDMKKHASMRGAGITRCNDVPDNITVIFHETPRANGPHGSTGCAEGFQSCGHVSILNAIANAAGIRITTLPATPEKVKAALEAKAAGRPYAQPRWELGCDLYERLEYLKAHPQWWAAGSQSDSDGGKHA